MRLTHKFPEERWHGSDTETQGPSLSSLNKDKPQLQIFFEDGKNRFCMNFAPLGLDGQELENYKKQFVAHVQQKILPTLISVNVAPEKLKQWIEDLQSSSNALSETLARVRDEGRALADRTGREINWKWVEMALTNIRRYQKEFSEGLVKRDPIAISYAARQFVSIRKYFEDTPLGWSELEKELRQHESTTTEKAGKIALAIDPFDPANLAEIRRLLDS